VPEKDSDSDYQRLYLTVMTEFASAIPTHKPEFVAIIFSYWSLLDDRFVETPKLYAIIDGERISYGAITPLGREVINEINVVTLGGRMECDDFLQLTAAKKVEMRLGAVEFTLDEHAFSRYFRVTLPPCSPPIGPLPSRLF
jgi:hypothetical protein